MEELSDIIETHLNPLPGATLDRVVYRPMIDEMDAEHMAEIPMFIGGEIVLHFGARPPLYIAWGENGQWSDHFSLDLRDTTSYGEGFLEDHDASAYPLWAGRVGERLQGWRIWGFNMTPHVVELMFPAGSVFIGDGWQTRFGDGDDVVASDRLGLSGAVAWARFASSSSEEKSTVSDHP